MSSVCSKQYDVPIVSSNHTRTTYFEGKISGFFVQDLREEVGRTGLSQAASVFVAVACHISSIYKLCGRRPMQIAYGKANTLDDGASQMHTSVADSVYLLSILSAVSRKVRIDQGIYLAGKFDGAPHKMSCSTWE